MLRPLRSILSCLGLLVATAAVAQAPRPVVVAEGLDNPWGLAFLPDGRWLVTEKPGRMRIVGTDGRIGAPLAGLPPVAATGQCGLLDVVLDPKFADNQRVYWTYAEPGDGGNGTAVASGRLAGDRLVDVKVLFSQKPKVSSRLHCGSRIAFARDGALLVGLGDRFSQKEEAQNAANQLGKVVRIAADGSASEVWSLGHRNIQGAALNPQTGELWTHEHGPQGGDEINVVDQGRNYGWPVLTYGRNYVTGTRIGDEGPRAGFEQPLKVWVPAIAPSGMAWLTSDRYPAWKGSLFVGALRAQMLVRLTVDGRKVTGEERLLTDWGQRIRDVRQGPDGFLYVLTDGNNAKIARLQP